MSLIVILFVTGVILLAADVFVSSFIMAIFGALIMFGGCALAYARFGGVAAGGATVFSICLLTATVYIELVWLPKTRFGRALVVQSTVDAKSQPAPAEAEAVVGKVAEALTTLAPSGYVQIDGKRYEAFCRSGLAAKGDRMTVVGVDNFRLIVSKT
jgi:membrane-bound serine protease (ClpP class)